MTSSRIQRLREKMQQLDLQAYLITSYENYRYFSGFTGSNCALLITQKNCYAFTDGRYAIQIQKEVKGFEICIVSGPFSQHVANAIELSSVSVIGYETHNITDFELRTYKDAASTADFVPTPDFVQELRAVKDETEISLIRRAARCADDAFSVFVKSIKRGLTERAAAALLEYEMARIGSEEAAFSTIAASGLNSAMPHATPQNTEIPDNCLMTFDFGATIGGYKSDITRTLHIGSPSKQLCELWDAVFEVQQKCISHITAGLSCRELSDYQCSLFSDMGLDKYIMHSLGHGIGLAIHESPNVSGRSSSVLCENMIITIEPGLYIEGVGGVRIEDSVLITPDGADVLTHTPHKINITL